GRRADSTVSRGRGRRRGERGAVPARARVGTESGGEPFPGPPDRERPPRWLGDRGGTPGGGRAGDRHLAVPPSAPRRAGRRLGLRRRTAHRDAADAGEPDRISAVPGRVRGLGGGTHTRSSSAPR